MMTETWTDKFNRFKAEPPFIKIRMALHKIPFQPIKISRFFFLSLDTLPTRISSRGGQTIRLGTREDIEGMCQLENKPNQFRIWFERGEYCVVALENDSVIGYEWFSIADSYREECTRYTFTIPDDTVYVFDAYIRKDYRLRGIWVKFKLFIIKWMQRHGRNKIVTMVEYGNDNSLKTHIHFGFNIHRDILWMSIFGRSWFYKKDISLREADIKKVLVR